MNTKDIFNPDGTVIKSYRLEFYKFALAIYNGVIHRETHTGRNLINYGFCAIFYAYFYTNPNRSIESYLPELASYKPKSFYNDYGDKTEEDDQFWFPVKNFDPNVEQVRIKILNDIISNFT